MQQYTNPERKFNKLFMGRPKLWNRSQGVCDIKVGVLPLVHDIFVKACGGSSRVVRGARLASVPKGGIAQGARTCEIIGGKAIGAGSAESRFSETLRYPLYLSAVKVNRAGCHAHPPPWLTRA